MESPEPSTSKSKPDPRDQPSTSAAAAPSSDVIDLTETDDEGTPAPAAPQSRCVTPPPFRFLSDGDDEAPLRLSRLQDSEELPRPPWLSDALSRESVDRIVSLLDEERPERNTNSHDADAMPSRDWLYRANESEQTLSGRTRGDASSPLSFDSPFSRREARKSSRKRKLNEESSPSKYPPPTSPRPSHGNAYSPHSASISPFSSLRSLSPYSPSPFTSSPPMFLNPYLSMPPLFDPSSLLGLSAYPSYAWPTPPPAHSHHSRSSSLLTQSTSDLDDARDFMSLHKLLNDATAAHLSRLACPADDMKPSLPVTSSSLFAPPVLTSPPTARPSTVARSQSGSRMSSETFQYFDRDER